jgi:hypothetical protein
MINPLSDQSFCGVDAKYDDIYLLIESKIEKINSLVAANILEKYIKK